MRTLLIATLVLFMHATAHCFEFKTQSAPELDAFFRSTNEWTGADGAYSIQLSRNKTLWLFSDTWIGEVKDGSRVKPRMINNSIAVQQHGKAPKFFWRTNDQGGAESFIKPIDGRGFMWLFAGTRLNSGVYFFLRHVEIVKPGLVFGFRGFDTSMAHIPNPDDPPHKWRVTQTPFPFDQRMEKELMVLGTAVLKDDGYVYVYGNSSVVARKGVIVARVKEKEFADYARWEFFSGKKWEQDFAAATPICPEAPAEASVSYWPAVKKFVFVYAQGLWGRIVMRTADKPEGPWSEPIALYQAPEMKYSDKVFCYAGKAHPQLGMRRNELIVTYASNSYELGEVIRDARLYFPHFIRVERVR
jgi:hypothetical protein